MNTEIALFRKSVEILQEKVDRYGFLLEKGRGYDKDLEQIDIDEESARAWDALLGSNDPILRDYAREHASGLVEKVRLSRKIRLSEYFSQIWLNDTNSGDIDPYKALYPMRAVELSHLGFHGLGGPHRTMLDIINRAGWRAGDSWDNLYRSGLIVLTGHSVPTLSALLAEGADSSSESFEMTTLSFEKSGNYDYEGAYKVGVCLVELLLSALHEGFLEDAFAEQLNQISPLWCWIDTSGWDDLDKKERLDEAFVLIDRIEGYFWQSNRFFAPTFIIT